MNKKKGFLGRGWKFPPAFDNKSGKTEMVINENDIQESLEILIGTQIGERVMQPKYGTGIGMLMFGRANLAMATLIENTLKESLTNFEPRIIVNDIQVDLHQFQDGILAVNIDYTVRTTNNRRNVVLPFYHTEGNLIPSRLINTS